MKSHTQLLIELYVRYKGTKLVYGQFDCAMFTLHCLDICDVHVSPPQWIDLKTAYKLFRSVETIEKFLTPFGYVKIDSSLAYTEDLIIIKDKKPHTIGMILYDKFFYIDKEIGLTLKLISELKSEFGILRKMNA
ncbi:MAG: hypothetical protein Q8P20_01285 [bacterium]|nr:hypothetical protein [bacterium]